MDRVRAAIIRIVNTNPRTLWRRYVLALAVLATVVVGGHLVSMSAFHLVDSDTRVGVITARQEGLNQRIVLSAMRLIAVRDDADMRRQLGLLIDEFETGHRTVLDGAGDPAMQPAKSERLRPIFFDATGGKPSLNKTIEKFIGEARGIETASDESSAELLARVDMMNSLNLHSRLQEVTNAFELDAKDRVHRIHMIQVAILALGLLTILIEFCFIFWPGHMIVQNALKDVEEKSGDLTASNEHLKASLIQARRARLEADHSNRAKSMFLANMSHELRTPLNAIIGFSSMIRNQIVGKVGNEQYVEYSGDIEQSGQQLLELISDLMDISQIEVGTANFDRRDFYVSELMGEVEPLARGWPMARERHISFEFADAPERFYGDPLRLRQILLNLLSNAIKFTQAGDAIAVIAKSHGDKGVQFIVEDTGRGFEVDDIEDLMQPFQRGDNAFTREREGVGLGLSLVGAFAKMHGGTVTLENADGGGARVIVTLPPGSRSDKAMIEAA